jgi:hypothetical protein
MSICRPQRFRRVTLALAVTLAVAGGLSTGANGAHAARVAANLFAGSWSRHGFTLNVAEDGTALAVWRIYSVCSDDPVPPCDSVVGDAIISGGRAAIVFDVDSAGDTLYGRTLISTDDTLLPSFGEVSLTLLPYDMAELDTETSAILLCGSQFAEVAPPEVQADAPCGG